MIFLLKLKIQKAFAYIYYKKEVKIIAFNK